MIAVLLVSSLVFAKGCQEYHVAAMNDSRAAQNLRMAKRPWEKAYRRSQVQKNRAIVCAAVVALQVMAIAFCFRIRDRGAITQGSVHTVDKS